jgi:hypothetical protein
LRTLHQILHDALHPTVKDLLAMEVREKQDGKGRKLRKMYMETKFWLRAEGNYIDIAYKYGYERKVLFLFLTIRNVTYFYHFRCQFRVYRC